MRALALALALPLASTEAGCGAEAAPPDRLVVLLPADPQAIDPRFVSETWGLRISRLLFSGLLAIDPVTLELVPDLAAEVVEESPTRYRVTLRDGLRFSDGSSLDADDVVATFRSLRSPTLGSRYARTFARIAALERADARTVVFVLEAPHGPFLSDLTVPILRAEDEHRRLGPGDRAPPAGAGPYVLARRAGGLWDLDPNPHWARGTPRFPRVRLVVVRDDNTRVLRLLGGAGDLVVDAVPPRLAGLFEGRAGFTVRTERGLGTTYLGLHTESPTLSDARVRRAIAHAIDRRLLLETKYEGRGRVADSFLTPAHWAHAEGLPAWAFDPAEARRLLDEVGLVDPDGPGPRPRAELVLRASSERFRASVARAIAAMLRGVGLAVDVRVSETPTLLEDLDRGRFDLALLQVPEVFEPHVLEWFFGSAHIPGPGSEGANRWRLRSPAVDAALEAGRLATRRDARRSAYGAVQRALAAALPVIPLWHEETVAVLTPRAAGFRLSRDARLTTLAW